MNEPAIELTPRELQVLQRLVIGQSNTQIALHLYLSVRTVETHVAHLLAKTGTYNRLQLANLAREHNLVNLEN